MNRPELRIGDVERDAAVSALGEHYAAGRITKEEYDARTDVAWQARTRSELAPLFADLPALHQQQRPAVQPPPRGSSGRPRRSRPPVLPVLLLVIVVAALSGLDVWPFVLLGVVYLWVRTWMGVAGARRWVQEQRWGSRGTTGEPWRPTTWR